jgi:hypothetical protein
MLPFVLGFGCAALSFQFLLMIWVGNLSKKNDLGWRISWCRKSKQSKEVNRQARGGWVASVLVELSLSPSTSSFLLPPEEQV